MSKGKKKEPIVSKFVRDAIFTAIAGMIIEPTLKGLKIEITPYLQWIWWAMFAFLIADWLLRNAGKVRRVRATAHPRTQRLVYPAIGVLTASLLIGGWFLVGAALTIKHKPRGPFTIAHGTRFVTDGFGKGLFWLKLNGVPKITPIDVIAFYTITNVKDTPSLLSDLIMEISGAGRQWYRLNVINQSAGAIWSADPRKPTARSSVVTFPAGYLLGKVSNHEFQPGEPIQGWLLCQIPPEYIPSPEFVQVRLTIRDTAGDEMVEELGDDPSHNSDVLYMEMEYRGEADPIGNYEIVPYRPKAD